MSEQHTTSSTFRALALLVVLGLAVTLLAACGGSTQPPAATTGPTQPAAIDGANLLDTRCSVCHSADRPKSVQKTQAEWEQTVTRMISKGAQLTAAEKAVLVDYLTKNYGK